MKISEKLVMNSLEISTLKVSVLVLSLISLTFAIMLVIDSSRDAVVIDRGCDSRLIQVASTNQTKDEVSQFLTLAVQARFNTTPPADPSAFMVQDLLVSRTKEQDELVGRGIDQRIIVRDSKLDGDRFLIEADRLVAIGPARSAIPLKLLAKVSSKARSMTNPYGLVLSSIDQVEVKNEKRK